MLTNVNTQVEHQSGFVDASVNSNIITGSDVSRVGVAKMFKNVIICFSPGET